MHFEELKSSTSTDNVTLSEFGNV